MKLSKIPCFIRIMNSGMASFKMTIIRIHKKIIRVDYKFRIISLMRMAIPFHLLLISGCSSSLGSIFERSVSSENITYDKIITLTGERRVALIVPYVDRRLSKNEEKEFYSNLGHARKVICAESLPDAARQVDTHSNYKLNLAAPSVVTGVSPSGEQAVDDLFKTTVTQTFQRTETADVVRQLGWQVCQGFANGAIDENGYKELVDRIISGSLEVLRNSSGNKK